MKIFLVLLFLNVPAFADIGVIISSNSIVVDKQVYIGDPVKILDVYNDKFLTFQFIPLKDPSSNKPFDDAVIVTIIPPKVRRDKAKLDMNNPALTPNERIDALIAFINLYLIP